MAWQDDIPRPPDELISTGDPNLDGDKYDGDDDPMITDDGYGVITPKFDEEAMLDALESPASNDSYSRLAPQQAYEEMKYMAPLSKAEKYILDTTPFLDDTLSWIDDPGHEDELFDYQKQKSKAMDNILDDQMYGDKEEQRLVRTGSDSDSWDDSGFGFKSLKRIGKKIGKGAWSGVKTAVNPVAMTKWSAGKFKAVGKMLANMAAWPIKKAIRPAINKTAFNIARKNGRARPSHEDVAAANKSVIYVLLHSKNPMFLLAGETLKHLGTGVSGLGSEQQPWNYDSMGNPALIAMAAACAVALTASIAAIIKASSAHAGATPAADDSQNPADQDPNAMDPNAMPPELSYPDPSMMSPPDAGEAMPYDQSGKLYKSIVDPLADMNGPGHGLRTIMFGGPSGIGRTIVLGDSLGAVASNIMGQERRSADEIAVDSKKSKKKSDLAKLVKAANAGDPQAMALVTMFAKAEEASEKTVASKDFQDEKASKIAVLAQRAKAGDKKAASAIDGIAKSRYDKRVATILGIDPFLYKLNPMYWLHNSRQKHFIDAEHKYAQERKEREKSLRKEKEDLEYGERAASAAAASQAAADAKVATETRLKELEGSLSGIRGYHDRPAPKSDLIGENRAEILGEYPAEILGAAGKKTKKPDGPTAKIDSKTWVKMAALGAVNPAKLNDIAKKNGIVMNATQKRHLADMVMLTKHSLKKTMVQNGVPAAKVNGNFIGSWGGFANALGRTTLAAATLPFKAAAYSYRTIKNAAFPGSAPPSDPTAVAFQRRLAALKRQQAASQKLAQAQTQYDAYQQAAQAESDAQAQEQATAQAQQDAQAEQYASADFDPSADSSSGAFVGANAVDEAIAGAFVGAWVADIKNPSTKAIVQKASEKSAIGAKIRAGARVYSAAMRGDAKAKIAIKKVSAKAKGGNAQAQADFNSIKAGKMATDARVAAGKKGKLPKKTKKPTSKPKRPSKFVAKQRSLENKAGNGLAQLSRAHKLNKASKLDRRAALGHKRSIKTIAAIKAKAAKGDLRAKNDMIALVLAQHVRKNAPTKAEHKRVMAAAKVVRGARKGKKKDLRTLAMVNAAAKSGQPNAKRALNRLKVGAVVATAITTGAVVIASKKKKSTATAEKKQKYAYLKGRVTSGIASKEEGFAASKMANELGLKKEAASLALASKDLPSANETLKNTASVARAAQGGNAIATTAVNTALEKAQAGDPKGISDAGKLAGVQAIDTVNKGGTMSPEMAEATALVQRAHAGDPEAKKVVKNVGEQVQANPTPEAVQAAIAVTAAGIVLSALAAKPTAMKEWNDKAAEARGESYKGPEAKAADSELREIQAKVKAGTATVAEASKGKRLAVALGKPVVAAQISMAMPPDDDFQSFSSLPDAPLPPITGWKGLLRETARAFLMATRDPVQNYREGVSSRSKTPLLTAIPGAKKTA